MIFKKFIMDTENKPNNEREEGEISDLDLEDVSDCSLTSQPSYKKGEKADYLSSVSEDSCQGLYYGCSSACKTYECDRFDCPFSDVVKYRKQRYKRDRIKRRLSSSDSESDVDRSLLEKLNKAVRVKEVTSETSLRSRLKKMTDKVSDDSECELIELRKQALESKLRESKEEEEEDEDKLRVEALRSAFLKKASLRKRNGVQSCGSKDFDDVSVQIKTVITDLLDYITVSDSEETKNEEPPLLKEQSENIQQIDEDEDILRALVLTSVAKNINKKEAKPAFPKPVEVKPLVINVGEDSDSDSSIDAKPKVPSSFEASLSQLLRNARANSDKTKINSVLQRLPESRKIEYLQLKQRLEQLSKKNAKLQQNVKKVIPKRQQGTKAAAVNKKHAVTAAHLVNQKRFLEGKYKNLAPIVKQTKAARLQRDRAGEEVKRLIEQLKIARIRYNDCHQTYKNCVQQYLQLKSDIAADVPATETNKRPAIDPAIQNKRMKTRATSNINIGKEIPAKPSPIIPKNPSTEVSVNPKRRSIDLNPLIEICPFEMQGSCRDVECKYRHLG